MECHVVHIEHAVIGNCIGDVCCKITLFADKFSLTAVVDLITAEEQVDDGEFRAISNLRPDIIQNGFRVFVADDLDESHLCVFFQNQFCLHGGKPGVFRLGDGGRIFSGRGAGPIRSAVSFSCHIHDNGHIASFFCQNSKGVQAVLKSTVGKSDPRRFPGDIAVSREQYCTRGTFLYQHIHIGSHAASDILKTVRKTGRADSLCDPFRDLKVSFMRSGDRNPGDRSLIHFQPVPCL